MLAELEDVGEEDGSWDSDDEDPEGILGIYELRQSWYPFPECWRGRTLWEEEEIADSGGSGLVEISTGGAGGGNSNGGAVNGKSAAPS